MFSLFSNVTLVKGCIVDVILLEFYYHVPAKDWVVQVNAKTDGLSRAKH